NPHEWLALCADCRKISLGPGTPALARLDLDSLETRSGPRGACASGRGDQLGGAEVLVRLNRPGSDRGANDNNADLIRKQAADFCVLRRNVTVPKADGNVIYLPSPMEIDEAVTARAARTSLWRLGDPNRLDQLQRKSLSSFSFGTNEFLLPPVMA